MKITKIISGAQTGADRAGIDAAMAMAFPYGGKIPAGRRAEGEPVPEHYDQLEVLPERNYLVRTEANVEDSDVTLVFTRGAPNSGSKRTIEFAWKHAKPVLHIDLGYTGMDYSIVANLIITWLESSKLDDIIINVAGSRESSCAGIHELVFHSMIEVIEHSKIHNSTRSQ